MTVQILDEGARRAALEAAEQRALALFDAIEAAGFVRPGRSERDVEQDIYELALSQFGVEKHWHKRIVRSGPNTLTTALENPPLRTIEEDDTVYVDLGPVFEAWEADIGRTYALNGSGDKQNWSTISNACSQRVQNHYRATPEITGAELYAYAQQAARDAGWEFGGVIAGHVVSEFAARLDSGREGSEAHRPEQSDEDARARSKRTRDALDPGNPPRRSCAQLRRVLRAVALKNGAMARKCGPPS